MGNGLMLVGLALMAAAIGGQARPIYDSGKTIATDSRFWPFTLLFAGLFTAHQLTTNTGVKSAIKALIVLVSVAFIFGIFSKPKPKEGKTS